MRKMIRRILILIYLCTLLPVAGAFLSQWISPNVFWPPAFLGLLFPALLILQLAFILIFMLFRSKAVFLPILVIVAGWYGISHTFQFNFGKTKQQAGDGSFKVMTYNVRLLDLYNWSGNKNAGEGILATIRTTAPDILCLQELLIQTSGRFSLEQLQEELKQLPYSYFDFNYIGSHRKHGLAIFSRYPIIGKGTQHFSDTHNMIMFADLLMGKDTIRVFNNHLESIHFEVDEFAIIDNKSDESRITREKVSVIIDRMKKAYKRRATQADLLRARILESPYPVVACGDFNDTPVSYAVHQVRKGLSDAFQSGGSGMEVTFPGLIIPLRIDYILHDKKMISSNFHTGSENYSDHRPVSCSIRFAGF